MLRPTLANTISETNGSDGSGYCVISNAYTNKPLFYDPDVGIGYAKEVIRGATTIAALKEACTEVIYQKLLTEYCKNNNYPVQEEVVTYKSDGTPYVNACSNSGCEKSPVLKDCLPIKISSVMKFQM